MNVGRVIFFDKITGEIIITTAEWDNAPKRKTIDEQIATYKELSERNRDTFDFIELNHGDYSRDFAEGQLIGVDLMNKKPVFNYPNPTNPDEPTIPDKPLSEELDDLKRDNRLLKVQNQALSDKAEFHDEVIAEIILTLYQ